MSDTLLDQPSAVSPTRGSWAGCPVPRTSILLVLFLVSRSPRSNPIFRSPPTADATCSSRHAPDASGGRAGPRDHHPQRRSLRRLHARAVGVPHRPTVPRPPGIPIVAVFAAGSWLGRCSARSTASWSLSREVPALVITLGTLYIYRGIVLTWAGGNRINAGDLRATSCGSAPSVLSIPVLTIVAAGRARRRRLLHVQPPGRRELYAIGSDPDAAILSASRSPARARRPSW